MSAGLLEHIEPRLQRRARWSGAFAGAAVFHAAVIAAIVLALPATESEDGGPIMLDLPPLSVEARTRAG